MSDYMKFDHYEAKPSIEDEFEYTSAIRVQCYSSFEYCLKRMVPMYPRRSFRLSKGSKEEFQESPSPNEECSHRQRTKKQKRTLWKTKVDDSGANTADETDQDILDIIDCAQQKHINIDEGWCAAVADEGVDFSDEDCDSVTSSISSGPSALHSSTAKTQGPSQGLCSACWNLHQKAKKMKSPIQDKLLDNDPKSLTCDQWVLLKQWRPKRLPNTRRKLSTQLHLVKKRLVKRDEKRSHRVATEKEQPVCSRPHVFLQRNLKLVFKDPVKPGRKRNRRKRRREDSWGPRVAKQQRLHGRDLAKHTSNNIRVVKADNTSPDQSSSQSTSSGFDGWSEQHENEMVLPEDTCHTLEMISSSVNGKESSKPQEARVKPKALKKAAGFRDLLAQMRANTSVIVKEMC